MHDGDCILVLRLVHSHNSRSAGFPIMSSLWHWWSTYGWDQGFRWWCSTLVLHHACSFQSPFSWSTTSAAPSIFGSILLMMYYRDRKMDQLDIHSGAWLDSPSRSEFCYDMLCLFLISVGFEEENPAFLSLKECAKKKTNMKVFKYGPLRCRSAFHWLIYLFFLNLYTWEAD